MPELETVSGKVRAAGKPLDNALVEIRPADGRTSTGKTAEDDSYSPEYTMDYDGAACGEHSEVVGIVTAEGDNDTDKDDEASGQPPSASDGSLKKTVNSGSNGINIDL